MPANEPLVFLIVDSNVLNRYCPFLKLKLLKNPFTISSFWLSLVLKISCISSLIVKSWFHNFIDKWFFLHFIVSCLKRYNKKTLEKSLYRVTARFGNGYRMFYRSQIWTCTRNYVPNDTLFYSLMDGRMKRPQGQKQNFWPFGPNLA